MSNDNEYMRKYMLKRYYERRDWAIKHLGGKCAKCGAEENLEIDHIDPATKTFSVSKMWNVAWEVFVEEINKCQLLCHECHVEKSQEDGSFNHENRARGEGCSLSKLTRQQVVEIRKRYKTGKYTYEQLAQDYPVSGVTVGTVVRRDTWKHVNPAP